MKTLKKYAVPLLMLAVFETVAVCLWLALDNVFYLFNFSYIGICLTVGLALYAGHRRYARRIVQFLVGAYMLVGLGILRGENMQLEGFWYYLLSGVFEAATIHYAVAKIFGPLIFGRGWCGYACWTAMILDLLPYRRPPKQRRKWGFVRYITFAVSLAYVGCLFLLGVPGKEKIMFTSFLVGNLLYYGVGIALALLLRDNRAFCKYVCPVTVFLKPASYFSLMRIQVDPDRCVSCGACTRACPMNVDIHDPSRKRINGTECILCLECAEACGKDAIRL